MDPFDAGNSTSVLYTPTPASRVLGSSVRPSPPSFELPQTLSKFHSNFELAPTKTPIHSGNASKGAGEHAFASLAKHGTPPSSLARPPAPFWLRSIPAAPPTVLPTSTMTASDAFSSEPRMSSLSQMAPSTPPDEPVVPVRSTGRFGEIGRARMAARLRVNVVALLLIWWMSESKAYKWVFGHRQTSSCVRVLPNHQLTHVPDIPRDTPCKRCPPSTVLYLYLVNKAFVIVEHDPPF